MQENIKRKTGWWLLSKTMGQETAHAIHPNIYVPEWMFVNLIRSDPDPYNLSVIEHEKVHIERQEEKGKWLWWALYLLSSRFRLEEELLAIKEEMRYIKQRHLEYDCSKKARALSSMLYLKCIDYSRAVTILRRMWEEL